MTLALLYKIAVPPILVALMTLAARRWGPTVGGLIMGLPWMTGPVLFVLTLDKGVEFAIAACTGIELAVISLAGFILIFGLSSGFAPWPVALASGIGTYFGIGILVQGLDVPLWVASTAGAVALVSAAFLLPKPKAAVFPGHLPWWDIPARVVATFALVAVILLTADQLGPRLSGIVATYPVILTVVGTFTLQQWGRDAFLRVLRGLSLSLLAFVGFFLVVGTMLEDYGLVVSFIVATIVAVGISAALIGWNNWRLSRIAQ